MKNFNEREFVCAGEIVFDKMNPDFLKMLDQAREIAAVPFTITSSYRTQKHNAKVGGKDNSAHTKGLAVDISVRDSLTRFKIIEAAIKVGFKRIGVSNSFIHIDNDTSKPQNVCWTY